MSKDKLDKGAVLPNEKMKIKGSSLVPVKLNTKTNELMIASDQAGRLCRIESSELKILNLVNPKNTLAEETTISMATDCALRLAAEITSLTEWYHLETVGRYYCLGTLCLRMEEYLAKEKKGRVSKAKYYDWENSLGISEVMIDKSRKLARLGPKALAFGISGGIDAVLEVGWIIKDMQEFRERPHKGTKSVSPVELQKALDDILAKFPFPDVKGLSGEDARQKYRIHADYVCTYYRLQNAGIRVTLLDKRGVRAWVSRKGVSIEKREANALAEHIRKKRGTATKKAELKLWSQDSLSQAVKTTSPQPNRIFNHLDALARWYEVFGENESAIRKVVKDSKFEDSFTGAKRTINLLQRKQRELTSREAA